MSTPVHRMGWIPDLPDMRDWRRPTAAAPRILAPIADLRAQCPPVDDQKELGSCTANSTGSAFAFADRKQGGLNIKPSRLFLYYGARAIDGWQNVDNGASIRSAFKFLNDSGAADETLWPYITSKVNQKPPQTVYEEAMGHQSLAYMRVDQNLDAMHACLADGFPFVFGFSVYENFDTAEASRTGLVPMPSGRLIGGHAVLAVGYNDTTRRFRFQNSWGTYWGQAGFGEIPYDYLTNGDLATDFWMLSSVEEVAGPVPVPPPDPKPVPVMRPQITAKQKGIHLKAIITGVHVDQDAVLFINEVPSSAGFDRQRCVVRLNPGTYRFIAKNPDGLESDPATVEIK